MKPSDIPLKPTKFALIINLKTAKGSDSNPRKSHAFADGVIE
jgi:hypothetical protein